MNETNGSQAEAKRSRQEKLEAVFNTVDKLKSDLSKATKITKTGKVLGLEVDGYAVAWAIVYGKLGRQVYGESENFIEADEFMTSFFPDAGTVLYRIGMKGEMIRGYIFLMNVKKEG